MEGGAVEGEREFKTPFAKQHGELDIFYLYKRGEGAWQGGSAATPVLLSAFSRGFGDERRNQPIRKGKYGGTGIEKQEREGGEERHIVGGKSEERCRS